MPGPQGHAADPVPPGMEYGVPLGYVQRLVQRWRAGFDWRAWEARLNSHPQFVSTIDGHRIRFLHIRPPEPGALPLILTHGWPSSIIEYLDLVGPLTDPRGHGGTGPAFHLVIPSIPGFGYSGPTTERGWSSYRVARAWAELMSRLGYQRYGAHGNDAGAIISPEIGRQDPAHVVGVHVTQLFSFPAGAPGELDGLTPGELDQLAFLQSFNQEMSAFAQLQATKPQNLAHALADSPAGQLAWTGQLLGEAVDPDIVLANATICWLTNTAASSARLYYEDRHASDRPFGPTTAPAGLAAFAGDFTPIRRLAERDHASITSWNHYDRGGHWAPYTAPGLLAADIREFFSHLTKRGGGQLSGRRPHHAHEREAGSRDRWPARVRVRFRAGIAGHPGAGRSWLRTEGRRLVQAGGRRRRVHVVSAVHRRTVGGLLYPRAARLASPAADRAPGPAGARRLFSRSDTAQRRSLCTRPVAGSGLPGLAVMPDARRCLRDMADARTAPVHQQPTAGPGDTATAARPGRKPRRQQYPGCRAGELARRMASSARPAPLRGGVLARPRRAADLPP